MTATPEADPLPDPIPPKQRTSSISVLLTGIAVLILLPTFVLTVVLLSRNHQAQFEITSSLTFSNTRSISSAVDREMDGMLTTLRVLSTSGVLAEGDMAAFHQRASDALSATGSHLLVIDTDMQQVINTRLPFGTPLPKTSDPQPVEDALASNAFVVSDIFFGAVSGEYVFNVILPVTLEDGRRLALVLTRNVDNLTAALTGVARQENWNAALLDPQLIVGATTTGSLETGALFPLIQDYDSLSFGRLGQIEYDDQAYLAVAVRSLFTDWFVVSWAPQASVNRPLWESLIWLALGALGIGVMIAVCIVILGGHLARAVRRLARDARLVGEGELVPARSFPVSELAEISRSLSNAALKRKEAETEVHFLMRELAHRAKNQLSVIQSMINQTAQSAVSFDAFTDDFHRRIFALSRSTDLMLEHGMAGTSLKNLIETHLEPFCPEEASRCQVSGPHIKLNAEAAQTIGMAMHELATNAVKHGAFSQDAGRTEVKWAIEGGRVRLEWREFEVAGTDAMREPRSGFGTLVMDRLVSSALNANVTRQMEAGGIHWTIDAPLVQMTVNQDTPQPERRTY